MLKATWNSSLAVAGLLMLLLPLPGEAQVIGLRTVPLAAGDQFLIFPSENLAMGGATIALDDALSDPFVNPATGARIGESRLFSAPTFYSVSEENGGARTMPIGVHLRAERWFGGGMVALQSLDMGNALRNWTPPLVAGDWSALPREDALASRSTTNRIAHFSIGREFGNGWAVGASTMQGSLNGTDGVEQLFANAWDIEELGSVRDYRLGVTGPLPGDRSIEVTLVRNVYDMKLDVTSVTWELIDSVDWRFSPEIREEEHRNLGKTWGMHVRYVQPLESERWKIGGVLTVNRKDHPKIPTYDLTAVQIAERPPIPRDPGHSWAFNVGAGLAYEHGPTRFAVDVIHEPAVSDTWADELSDVVGADGTVIPAGGHTVDNHFDFSNAHANVGLRQAFKDDWAFQFGVRVRSYSYRMEQEDHVTGLDRKLTQQWTEWTPSWGLTYQLDDLTLQYTGLATSATHFPLPNLMGDREVLNPGSLQGPDTLAPPAGRLFTPDETTVTHRLQISLPIR